MSEAGERAGGRLQASVAAFRYISVSGMLEAQRARLFLTSAAVF